MTIGKQHPRLSQVRVDDLRDAARWARDEAQARAADSADWMRAVSAAQSFDALADELQAELDALPPL